MPKKPPRRPRSERPRRQQNRSVPASPLRKKLLIGVPVAVGVVFLLFKIFDDRDPKGPKLNVDEIQSGSHVAKGLSDPEPDAQDPKPSEPSVPMVDRSNETREERTDRAEATLGNFFAVGKKEGLLPYVRHPKRVAPLIADYYSRNPFEGHEFLGLKSDLQEFTAAGPGFYAAEADIGSPRSRTMILEDTPKGFRIDWEYYVQYNPMDWSTFIEEAPAPAMDFRVYANLAPDYRHPFTDEQRYIGVNLMTLNDTSEIMGYAERNSELGKRLQEFLANKHEELCILRLQFPSGSNSGAVYIRELVNPHWIITDEATSE